MEKRGSTWETSARNEEIESEDDKRTFLTRRKSDIILLQSPITHQSYISFW